MVVRLPATHRLRGSLKPLNAAVEKKAALIFASFLISFACFRDTGGQKAAGAARASSMAKINDKLEFNSCEYLTYIRSISRMV